MGTKKQFYRNHGWFLDRFYDIDSQIEEFKGKIKSDFEKLRAFEPNPHSKGFTILVKNLFSDIPILEPDDELKTEDEILEENLRDEIKAFKSF